MDYGQNVQMQSNPLDNARNSLAMQQGLAGPNLSGRAAVQAEPTLAKGIERLQHTGKVAHETRDMLNALVERLRPGNSARSDAPSGEPKAMGAVAELHHGIGGLDNTLGEIRVLLMRLDTLLG